MMASFALNGGRVTHGSVRHTAVALAGVALLCGVALLGEGLQPLQWLGAALALVSVLLINRRAELWQPSEVPADPAEVLP